MSADREALKQVQVADVYKAGVRAATLTRSPQGVVFAYLPEASRPVATSLPLDTPVRVQPGGSLPAYFTGLLPEGRRLSALRREVKTSADDELTLLLAVGADTIGDVQVVPEGVAPEAVPPALELDDLTQLHFRDVLADLGVRAERTALPGVQDKASALMLTLPAARKGARFLLKLDPPEFRHLVENEAFFLEAARRSGLDAVRATVVRDAEDRPGLLVERFDRTPVGPLAVEDACQVLDIPPGDKYLVSTERALGALVGVCQAPLPAARTLLRQFAFAHLTGNGDAHAKNFSVLQEPDGEWRPSPAYDVPSSQPYGDTTMALSLGGRGYGDFGGRDFVELGATLGLPEKAVRRALRELAERSELWLPDLDQLPFDAGTVAKLRKVVLYRRKRLLQ